MTFFLPPGIKGLTRLDLQEDQNTSKARSSYRRCSIKKGVLRNFAKFTGKHMRQSLFFNKVASLRPVTLLKKRLWHRGFPVNFAKFLRTSFFTEHLRWLLPDKSSNLQGNFQYNIFQKLGSIWKGIFNIAKCRNKQQCID